MTKIHAGDIVDLEIDGQVLSVKIEDGSKSDVILAKIVESAHAHYTPDHVYEFTRDVIAN